MRQSRRTKRKDHEKDIETVSYAEDPQDSNYTIEARDKQSSSEADNKLNRPTAAHTDKGNGHVEISVNQLMMNRKSPGDTMENSSMKTEIHSLQNSTVDCGNGSMHKKRIRTRSPQNCHLLGATVYLRNEHFIHVRKEEQDSKGLDHDKKELTPFVDSSHGVKLTLLSHVQAVTSSPHQHLLSSYNNNSTNDHNTKADSPILSHSQSNLVDILPTTTSIDLKISDQDRLDHCDNNLVGSKTADIASIKDESCFEGDSKDRDYDKNQADTLLHGIDRGPVDRDYYYGSIDTFKMGSTEIASQSIDPKIDQHQEDSGSYYKVDVPAHDLLLYSDAFTTEPFKTSPIHLENVQSQQISTHRPDTEHKCKSDNLPLVISIHTDVPTLGIIKSSVSEHDLYPHQHDILIIDGNLPKQDCLSITASSGNLDDSLKIDRNLPKQDHLSIILKSEIDETKSLRIRTLKESYERVNALKVMLLLGGSKIHQGKGADRLFADYWDSLQRYLSIGTSQTSSVRTHRNCADRDLNGIEIVLKSFLCSKQLRALHNQLILELMKQSTEKFILKSVLQTYIPNAWKKNIIENPLTNRTINDNEMIQSHPLHSIMHHELLERLNEYLGFYSGTWTVSGGIHAHTHIDSLPTVTNHQLKPLTSRFSSPTVPGILEISLLLSRLGTYHNVKISDRVINILATAVKEQVTQLLRRAIYSIDETKMLLIDSKTLPEKTSPKKGGKKTDTSSISPPRSWMHREKQLISPFTLASALDINPIIGHCPSNLSTSRLSWERCISSINISALSSCTEDP